MTRVLIIEDDAATRALYTQMLEDDYEVATAADGASGVFAAVDHKPALILLDLSMPRLGGWNVVEMLQQDARTADIPIVVVTGHDERVARARAEEMGCAGFLSKPFEEEEVLELVARLAKSTPDR